MRESKFKSYADLPLTLFAPEVAEVLGISRAAAYALVRSRDFPSLQGVFHGLSAALQRMLLGGLRFCLLAAASKLSVL